MNRLRISFSDPDADLAATRDELATLVVEHEAGIAGFDWGNGTRRLAATVPQVPPRQPQPVLERPGRVVPG